MVILYLYAIKYKLQPSIIHVHTISCTRDIIKTDLYMGYAKDLIYYYIMFTFIFHTSYVAHLEQGSVLQDVRMSYLY